MEDHPSTVTSASQQSQFNRGIRRVSESLFVPHELRSRTPLSSDFASVVPDHGGGASLSNGAIREYEQNDPDINSVEETVSVTTWGRGM